MVREVLGSRLNWEKVLVINRGRAADICVSWKIRKVVKRREKKIGYCRTVW